MFEPSTPDSSVPPLDLVTQVTKPKPQTQLNTVDKESVSSMVNRGDGMSVTQGMANLSLALSLGKSVWESLKA